MIQLRMNFRALLLITKNILITILSLMLNLLSSLKIVCGYVRPSWFDIQISPLVFSCYLCQISDTCYSHGYLSLFLYNCQRHRTIWPIQCHTTRFDPAKTNGQAKPKQIPHEKRLQINSEIMMYGKRKGMINCIFDCNTWLQYRFLI